MPTKRVSRLSGSGKSTIKALTTAAVFRTCSEKFGVTRHADMLRQPLSCNSKIRTRECKGTQEHAQGKRYSPTAFFKKGRRFVCAWPRSSVFFLGRVRCL